MKNFRIVFLLFAGVVWLAGCQQTAHKHTGSTAKENLPSTGNFGKQFPVEGALPASEIITLFGQADSIPATLGGPVAASCKHSGCWMDVAVDSLTTVHVTFRDESFTVPLDAVGKNAVFQGTAFRSLIPVETLRDYAREEGKSEEEIAAITEPVWEYEFIANGVVISE